MQHNIERKSKEPIEIETLDQQDMPQQEEDTPMTEDKDFTNLGGLDLMALKGYCCRNSMRTIPPKQIHLLATTLKNSKAKM